MILEILLSFGDLNVLPCHSNKRQLSATFSGIAVLDSMTAVA
jgi:hypothetical protein